MITLRGALQDKFPSFLGIVFRSTLTGTKTQEVTEKSSEHNWRTFFLKALALLTFASTGVVLTLSYHWSYIFIALPHNFR